MEKRSIEAPDCSGSQPDKFEVEARYGAGKRGGADKTNAFRRPTHHT